MKFKICPVTNNSVKISRYYGKDKNNITNYQLTQLTLNEQEKYLDNINMTNTELFDKYVKRMSYDKLITHDILKNDGCYFTLFEYVFYFTCNTYSNDMIMKCIVTYKSDNIISMDSLTQKTNNIYTGKFYLGVIKHSETSYKFTEIKNVLNIRNIIESKICNNNDIIDIVNNIIIEKNKEFDNSYQNIFDNEGNILKKFGIE